MSSETVFNGKPSQHCMKWRKWIAVFAIKWQRYCIHDERQLGIADICPDSSDICIPG